MQGQAAFLVPLAQLHPDHKAQTAGDDHEHDHCLHIVVVDIGHQRGVRPEPSEEVKARIAEGRNGGEYADPDALQPELRHKGEHQQQNADAFKHRCQPHHDLQHTFGLIVAVRRNAFAQQPQIPEAHAPAHGQRKKAGKGNKTKAAHLNEQQHHCLPEPCELRPRIPHHQTGDAGGAGGCEHGVEHIQPSVPAGNRQGEQQRAQRDDSNKADADDLGRGAQSQLSPPDRPLVPQLFADIFYLFHSILPAQHAAALHSFIAYTILPAGST